MSQVSSLKARHFSDEWQLRVDLAAAFRLAVRMGWHEAVANHFSVAVSPDGRHVVYAVHDEAEDEQWLFERPLGATTSRRIPGTRGAMAPFSW